MKAIVSKKSIRELMKTRRLPSHIEMFLGGAWLLEVLKANSLDSKFRLWHLAYRAAARSVNRTQMLLTWRPIDA
jgi:hypothetical protein